MAVVKSCALTTVMLFLAALLRVKDYENGATIVMTEGEVSELI